ncbi:hypothetical protein DL98DRAFT_199745 [Cadophora sp. DSE1049]|nr:hypothetical protein DL98DRAFT_199745 [Cadophora sp. DSE1049]
MRTGLLSIIILYSEHSLSLIGTYLKPNRVFWTPLFSCLSGSCDAGGIELPRTLLSLARASAFRTRRSLRYPAMLPDGIMIVSPPGLSKLLQDTQ